MGGLYFIRFGIVLVQQRIPVAARWSFFLGCPAMPSAASLSYGLCLAGWATAHSVHAHWRLVCCGNRGWVGCGTPRFAHQVG